MVQRRLNFHQKCFWKAVSVSNLHYFDCFLIALILTSFYRELACSEVDLWHCLHVLQAQLVLLVILLVAIVNFMIGTFIPPSEMQQQKGISGYSSM